MIKNACFITNDWEEHVLERVAHGLTPRTAGGGQYRITIPSRALTAAGWTCKTVPTYALARDGSMVGIGWGMNSLPGEPFWDADIIITQRWMTEDAERIARGARAAGQIVIADVDDHYWELPLDNPARTGTDPFYSPDVNRAHYWRALGAMNGIIVSTPELYSYLQALDVPIWLCRNMMDLQEWTYDEPVLAERERLPSVGWTGETLFRKRDLTRGSYGAVGQYCAKHDVEFIHVGHRDHVAYPPAGVLLDCPARLCQRRIPHCTPDTYPKVVEKAGIDIGIVPLEDSPFNRAKSCLKGMEYCAAGIPYIASALPEYEFLDAGILVKSYKDWMRALESMLDPEVRYEYALLGHRRVAAEDWRVRGKEYVDLFEELLRQ